MCVVLTRYPTAGAWHVIWWIRTDVMWLIWPEVYHNEIETEIIPSWGLVTQFLLLLVAIHVLVCHQCFFSSYLDILLDGPLHVKRSIVSNNSIQLPHMYSYEYRCSEVWRRKRLWITYPSNGFPSLACCINARGGHQWEGKHAFEDRTSEFEALDVGQMIFNIWPSQVSPIRSSAENWMFAWCHYEETKAMRFSFIFILFTFITGQISTIIRY